MPIVYPSKNVVWVTGNTFQLYDARTNKKYRVVVPYADEPDFYSQDELDDIVGHAVERFERECAEAPTHQPMKKQDQHDMGAVLNEIKEHREQRKELGGPLYHQGLSSLGSRD